MTQQPPAPRRAMVPKREPDALGRQTAADRPEQSQARLTTAERAALEWFRENGGDAVLATHKAGGKSYIAQGETGRFMPVTMNRLVRRGAVERYELSGTIRYRLTGKP